MTRPENLDLDALIADTERQVAAMSEFQRRLSEVTGEGYGLNGMVHARTGSSGALEQLTIDPRAMRTGSQLLAEEIVAASKAAAAQAAQAMADIAQELLGQDAAAAFAAGPPTPPDLEKDPDVQEALNELARFRSRMY